jgi:hypothetical protein
MHTPQATKSSVSYTIIIIRKHCNAKTKHYICIEIDTCYKKRQSTGKRFFNYYLFE